MGYRGSLVWRWTRRDRLAVVVVAVTVAFFTGSVLVVDAASSQTTEMAAEYGPVGYVSTGPGGAVELPISSLTDGGTYVGIPSTGPAFESGRGGLPPPDTVTLGETVRESSSRLRGESTSLVATVHPRQGEVFVPSHWYSGPAGIAVDLGTTSTVGLEASQTLNPSAGSPLRGALAFFVHGSQSLLTLLRLLTVGAAVLVAVSVYSVVRMTVRDRRETILVLRATGGQSRTVLGLFVARALMLTLVGVLAGYAVGVVVPNAAVNAAVFAGLPVALPVHVTPVVVATLLPGYVTVLVAGGGAGALAARPAVRRAVLDDTNPSWQSWRLPGVLRPRLLGWRPFVPAATALAVFVVITVLFSSVGAAVVPVLAPTGSTVSEPGASHPLASTVPKEYADALETTGVSASPEILLFSASEGTPFLSRGAEFDRFANVSDAELVAGRSPESRGEAVIGAGLADSLGVEVGDELVVGGSTRAAFTRVNVVGRFEGAGVTDDQLVVSLPTARHLSGKPPGTVQFLRLSGTVSTPVDSAGVRVLSVAAPSSVVNGSTAVVDVTVANLGEAAQNASVRVRAGGVARNRSAALGAFETTTLAVEIPFERAGNRTVRVDDRSAVVEVRERSALQLSVLPERTPPNTDVRVRVSRASGAPVSNATVAFGPSRATTNETGVAVVTSPDAGEYEVRAATRNETVAERVYVSANASTELVTDIVVSPSRPQFGTRPTAEVSVANPWTEPRTQTVRVQPPGTELQVRVPAGGSVSRSVQLDRLPPGDHTLTVFVDGDEAAEASFTVEGDDRVVAALATRGGGTRGSSIGQAVRTVFGNLQVLVGSFVVLGALVTVGSVTAGFAYAVRARRETIGVLRATGATSHGVLARVLGDALRVGTVALGTGTAVGYGMAFALSRFDYTTVFGVSIAPRTDLTTLGAVFAGGLCVVVLGALVAAYPLARQTPRALLLEGGGE